MSNLFNEMMEEISEKDKKITELEAKIAESEREKQTLIKGEYKKCCEDCCAFDEQAAIANDYLNACNQLKQQLAEKEKEVIKLNNNIVIHKLLLSNIIKSIYKDGFL